MSEARHLIQAFTDVDLTHRTTFAVPARALTLLQLADPRALPLLASHLNNQIPIALGGGSNLLCIDVIERPMVHFSAAGIEIRRASAHDVIVRVEAGLAWHDLVMQMTAQGYFGLQNLALIPGTVGAAPIQNIGAYGVEVCQHIDTVEAWNYQEQKLYRFTNAECAFAYRDSRFKQEIDQWLITAAEFRLSTTAAPSTHYAGIQEQLDSMQIINPTPSQVAQAVIALRQRKLPDPATLGNAGSFFKNPIVPRTLLDALLIAHASMPFYPDKQDDGLVKLSAAWLIEQSGWKGFREGDAAVAEQHALVLVNHGHATGAQILSLARRIAADVKQKFSVDLVPEPRVIGASW